MRPFILVSLVAVLLPTAACREDQAAPPVAATPRPLALPQEPQVPASAAPAPAAPRLASSVSMADPAVENQLVKGFHGVETGWRWTEPAFSLSLGVPLEAAAKGAVLRFKFSVPQSVLTKRKKVVLTVKVGDLTASKEVTTPDAQELELELPASALAAGTVSPEFSVDEPFVPGGGDIRQLGVTALAAELAAKP